jgi:hypothetical protein
MRNLKVVGIVSDRDLLNAFIHVMGIKAPGALLGIVVDEDIEEMERIIHALYRRTSPSGPFLYTETGAPESEPCFPIC